MNTLTEQIKYRTYTIEPDYRNPYSNRPEFIFYPTDKGRDDDPDCGNVRHASTIEEAKNEIDCAIEAELIELLKHAAEILTVVNPVVGKKELLNRIQEAIARATALQNS
jgi:hypothetical protein